MIYKILRIFIGSVFLFSAMAKLISIDEFEIVVYRFGHLGLNFSIVLSRLIIVVELIIGTAFVLNFYINQIRLAAMLLILFFALVLFVYVDKNSDCICFGEMIKLSFWQSILKNGLLLVGILFIKGKHYYYARPVKQTAIGILMSIFLFPFICSPPDFIQKGTAHEMNEKLFKSLISSNEFNNKPGIYSFYSTGCDFCKLAERKMSVLIKKHQLNNIQFFNFFWGNPNNLYLFYNDNSVEVGYAFLKTEKFLEITKGSMPLIVLYDGQSIKGVFGYRSFNEKQITDFLYKLGE